jgi:hypothetical protein
MKSFDELYHEFDKSSYRTPDCKLNLIIKSRIRLY